MAVARGPNQVLVAVMSAGHGHKRPNLCHPLELHKLLAEGGAAELMKRWRRLDVDHDITSSTPTMPPLT